MSSIATIRRYVNDPDGVTFPDAYLYDALNDALLDMSADTKHILTTASWTLGSGADLVALHADVMIPQTVIYNNQAYFFSAQADLERWSPDWQGSEQGLPKWYIRWDADSVRVWPRPNQQYVVQLVGLPWPTEISGTSTSVDTDVSWRTALEHLTAAYLLEIARPDLADIHMNEYMKARNDFNVHIRNNQPHRLRQLRPGNNMDKAQGGSISIGRWYR